MKLDILVDVVAILTGVYLIEFGLLNPAVRAMDVDPSLAFLIQVIGSLAIGVTIGWIVGQLRVWWRRRGE